MANSMDEGGYNDSNRAFLQAFMARSTMTFEEARPVLAAIFSAQDGQPISAEDITEDDLASYIAAANSAISPFDLEIRSTLRQAQIDQQDGANNGGPERVYALVNTTSDALMQLATIHTADEIAFVKRLLDAMFETHNTRISEGMVITGMQAMQLAKAGDANRRESGAATQQSQGGAAQSLSMSQAEMVMSQLVDEGWFEKSRKGFYSLSPRGLMELRGWLVATYNDENDEGQRANKIKFCAACRDIITVGQRCGNRDCHGRLHDHCLRNFFRVQQAEKCPVCKADWPGNKFVGERAITSTERHMQNKRRSMNTQRRSDVGSSTQVASDDANEEENSDEDGG
ncbi:hypothetical protein ASPWEDRAFT_172770 [Aspergillus wentii DTO 134E9]|uniref:Non-structural maintenance of chromosomes element 1 homolog n=1 Tax=Aspergillus wentii DTO 134E9 TaxID=1073089 RepID=A0A1L9RME3_ASPWE|nr:uncharacterized protein ASPWEDRAFT_172770 [Aspergillus wentii DTO 134E9]OJJ35988.1 hypothetical protein ASPWEDRAFT_172770 [Aspergillus wentii DTO 134E9]